MNCRIIDIVEPFKTGVRFPLPPPNSIMGEIGFDWMSDSILTTQG